MKKVKKLIFLLTLIFMLAGCFDHDTLPKISDPNENGLVNLSINKSSSVTLPSDTNKVVVLFKGKSNSEEIFQTKVFTSNTVTFNMELYAGDYKMYLACINSNDELVGISYDEDFEILAGEKTSKAISISPIQFEYEKNLTPAYYKTRIVTSLYEDRSIKFLQYNSKCTIIASNLYDFFYGISANTKLREYYKHESWDIESISNKFYTMNIYSDYQLTSFLKPDSTSQEYYRYLSRENESRYYINLLVIKPLSYQDTLENYPVGKTFIKVETPKLTLGDQSFYIRTTISDFNYTGEGEIIVN